DHRPRPRPRLHRLLRPAARLVVLPARALRAGGHRPGLHNGVVGQLLDPLARAVPGLHTWMSVDIVRGVEAADGAHAEDLDVSVVLPVYNERGHVREEIDRIR